MSVQDALMIASFAVRIAPALGRAYYEMAAAQEAQGNHAAALANVQQAMEYVPQFSRNLGQKHYLQSAPYLARRT